MARGRASASSTKAVDSPSAAFPLAWRFEGASDAMVGDLASALGVRSVTRAAVAVSLSDPDGVRARIAKCPLLSAVALEILADVGGGALTAAVGSELARRTGVPLAVAEKAVRAAGSSLACVFTTPDAHHRRHLDALLLIDICAGPIAALVRGLTLPRAAPPDNAPAAPSRGARDTIALVGLTAHRPLKLTQSGSPNGMSLKSLIKGTGVDYESAEHIIRGAQDCGLLGESGQARVRADALITFAAGRADPDDDARREAWLPRGRWVSLEAAQRALVALHHSGRVFTPHWMIEGAELSPKDVLWLALAHTSPWLDVVEHAGATWLRRRAAAVGEGTGDGYVTPSFEVILGPAAAMDVVAEVALGCELTRVDNMLTFRLAPRSVEAGLAAGMDGASFLRALARVGPRGLPENVRAMVEDWIQSARLARVEQAVIVRVAARSEGALASALGADLLGRLGPGVLVVRPPAGGVLSSPGEPEIAKRLAKIGYRVCSEESRLPPHASNAGGEALSLPPSHAPLTTLWPEPDLDLTKRFGAARAQGFRDEMELLSRVTKPAAGASGTAPPQAKATVASAPPRAQAERSAELPQHRSEIDIDEAGDELDKASKLAAQMLPGCRAELDRWISRIPSEQRVRIHRTLDYPLFWAPFIALLPKYRDRVLARARSVEGAVLEAWRLCGAARRHRQGSVLMDLARAADLTEPDWYEALDALHGSFDGADVLTPIFGPPCPATPPRSPEAPAAQPSPSSSAPAKGAVSAAAPGRMSPDEILARIERAYREERSVVLGVVSGEGVREQVVRVMGVRTLGRDTRVLVTDTATDLGHALPIEQIRSVAFVAPA